MKTKIAVTAIAALFSTALFAQKMVYDAGKTTFGVRAGANFTTITGEYANDKKADNKIKSGFHAGLNAEVPLGTGFYLQPGVLYSQKGAEYKGDTGQIRLSYIEVPVNFVYKPTIGAGRLLLGAGPYVGFGVKGTAKYSDGRKMDVEFTTDYDALSGPQLKRVDAGANFLAGYEFNNNISLQLNAQLGLTHLPADDVHKTKNTGFGISAGYRF